MVNIALFSKLVPLRSLLPADRAQLSKQASILEYAAGAVIFSRGELARTQAYLLDGEIELQSESATNRLRAGTPTAAYPFAPGSRRDATALALGPCKILFVDRELLDLLLTWSQTSGIEATELHIDAGGAKDWITGLLQSKSFQRVPPGNIAQVFAQLAPVKYNQGEVIIQQGDAGDFYYIITEGRVQIVLQDASGLNEEELAQLGVGKGFGEEALVSGEPRNATARALTSCSLMRLSGAQFAKLLKAPMLRETSLAEVPAGGQLVDVRVAAEFVHGHLPGAINLPLAHLRERAAHVLDKNSSYFVYCETGRRSASATYLLSERGFDAKLIRGGVSATLLTQHDD
jgi:CRP-like cAMP-binding protein